MTDVWADTAFESELVITEIFEQDFGIQTAIARDMAAQVIDLFMSNPEMLDELKDAIGE